VRTEPYPRLVSVRREGSHNTEPEGSTPSHSLSNMLFSDIYIGLDALIKGEFMRLGQGGYAAADEP